MTTRPIKKRRLSPVDNDEKAQPRRNGTRLKRDFLQSAVNWDLEANYLKKNKKDRKKESTRLPIRTPNGAFARADDDDEVVSNASEEDLPGSDAGGSNDDAAASGGQQSPEPSVPEHVQILEAQEELARIALLLNEQPEENAGAFKALSAVGARSKVVAVQKLALVTQLAVYRDVIPGYRIRAPGSEDRPGGERLSKEVRRLRTYETALVAGYQGYLKDLARYARLGNGQGQRPPGKALGQQQQQQSISSVAISCACALVASVPHFNFRSDLLRILVGRLSRRPRRPRGDDGSGSGDPDFDRCCDALETLFLEDDEGRPSFEAVGLLAKMMRAREYRVDERVLNLFLHLRLLGEFSGKASKDRVEHSGDGGDGSSGVTSVKPAKGKGKFGNKREFRTKRERKNVKEHKALERDMAQADALVGHEERERMQSETLKLVFATYFRVLKLRQPGLMGAVLEGLAKYAHLINQDFFGDLLEALKDLVRDTDALLDNGGGDEEDDDNAAATALGESATADGGEENDKAEPTPAAPSLRNRDPAREALLCTVAAYALLAGQDAHASRSALHLDLSFFTAHMYRDLLPLCLRADLEDHKRRDTIPSSTNTTTGKQNKVNHQTPSALLLRALSALLLPRFQARAIPPTRLAAFAKRVATAGLQTPERTTRALLALLADVLRVPGNKGKVGALWHTELRRGDAGLTAAGASLFGGGGVGGAGDGSAAFGEGALAATVWEGEILRRHYSPAVREGVKILEGLVANMD